MKIKLDEKHTLHSDPFCCWIMKEGTSKDGKPTEKNVSGYYPTLEMLVDGYIDKSIRGSEAEKIKDIVRELKEIKKTVKGWRVTLEEIKEKANVSKE